MQVPAQNTTQQAWLAAIIEGSEDAIIAKDLAGIVTGWNAAAERLFGYSSVEMLGCPLTVIFPASRLHEETMILGRIARGERVEHYETERQHKDGRIFPVSVTVSPIRNAEGDLVGASNITRDLTEREAQERRVRELQSELVHVQRLGELGQLVSALAHEVNQPLTAITNYLNACRRLAAAGNLAAITPALQKIADQTQRTHEVVQRIRAFVKKRDIELRAENLSEMVSEAVELTRDSTRGEGVKLRTKVSAAVRVEADRIQVQQVLFNLMRNGIEATQGRPRREISIDAVAMELGIVRVSVADSGPGLAAEVQSRLFQPFVTTKPNGMGVGLSVCHAIIEAHGGRLWAENAANAGAVFRFTLKEAGQQPNGPKSPA
jgi:two-component system, LuxR family, sensor kinase FixL